MTLIIDALLQSRPSYLLPSPPYPLSTRSAPWDSVETCPSAARPEVTRTVYSRRRGFRANGEATARHRGWDSRNASWRDAGDRPARQLRDRGLSPLAVGCCPDSGFSLGARDASGSQWSLWCFFGPRARDGGAESLGSSGVVLVSFRTEQEVLPWKGVGRKYSSVGGFFVLGPSGKRLVPWVSCTGSQREWAGKRAAAVE
ncbi:unnamed protein product [Calypogeia fissa]